MELKKILLMVIFHQFLILYLRYNEKADRNSIPGLLPGEFAQLVDRRQLLQSKDHRNISVSSA
jgi:hypothetical protein